MKVHFIRSYDKKRKVVTLACDANKDEAFEITNLTPLVTCADCKKFLKKEFTKVQE